jgi:SAM-dependent methyltransferase
MKHRDDAVALGPDGYSRFFVIINLLERFYGKNKKTIRILDVGGCSPYMYELLSESDITFELTILDILPKPPGLPAKATYIQADATASDLADGSFDVVVSTDTLEHIPAPIKDNFVRACVRLSKDVCIMAAPFSTEGVDQAEHFVNDFNKQLFRVGQDWLVEHFEYGKPSVAAVSKVLQTMQVPFIDFGTNNLYSWIFSTHMNLIEAKVGLNDKQSEAVRRTYNQLLAQSAEFTGPTYRHFFVASKNPSFVIKDPLTGIADTADPSVFGAYVHDMFKLVADRMMRLHNDSIAFQEKNDQLAQQLENERIHSHKLNNELILRNAELQRLAPLRRLARLRHPKHVAKAVKKRLTGK